MKVGVVTPYYGEPVEWLRACNDSVARQTHPCTHIMVADGAPFAEIDSWPADHIVLPENHDDFGSTPRLIGSNHAIALGCDAIAYLDADCWYREDHVATLVDLLISTGAGFASSGRMLCRPDGSVMRPCPEIDPDHFVDTNCMIVGRAGFPTVAMWGRIPSYGHVIGDRIMLHYFIESGIGRAHSPLPSVYYRAKRPGVYRAINEPIPEGLEVPPDYAAGHRQWEADGFPSLQWSAPK